jgi:hypothetical protein
MAHFPRTRVATGRLIADEVNAAAPFTSIITPRAGSNIRVLDGWLRAVGSNADGATAVVVEDTGGTDVFSATVGALTDALVARAGISNFTVTNMGATLGTGKGLRATKTGGTFTVTTGLDYMVKYVYEPVNNVAS